MLGMRRSLLTSIAVALLVLPSVLSAPARAANGHAADGRTGDWSGRPTMVAGTAGYDAGEWAYTDYPYDDKGAGAFAYPSGAGWAANAADVVVLRISVDANAVHYLAEMNTLIAPDSTVLALAVDTDADDKTGGGPWPRGADVSTLGWEHLITVWGTGGEVQVRGGRTQRIASAANIGGNVIEFSVPRAIADPGSKVWRYRGASGVWDRAAQSWAEVVASSPVTPATSPTGGDGSAAQPDVFNLLFRNRTHDQGSEATDENESPGFQFARQSAALTSRDLGPFARRVDFGLIERRAKVAPEEPSGDAHVTRVYASRAFPNKLAEGVTRSSNGVSGSLYNGRFQPYRLFVPGSYRRDPRPAPMIPMLHGWMGDHRGFNPGTTAFWTKVVAPNRALVPKPLGRGQEMWYEHVGEFDVLEVMADVARHYRVDADRIYLGGTSMGGLGTLKIAEAHPDLFAGILPSVPPMSDRATGYAVPGANDWDLVEQVDSLRNVPTRNFTGTYDALVPAGNDSRRLCDRLRQLVYDYDCWRDISTNGTHRGYENDRAEEIAQLLREHRLVRNPERVTYEVHPVWRQQAADAGISDLLRYDSAYWVESIVPAAPSGVPEGLDRRVLGSGYAEVDVRTYGRGVGDPVATPIPDDPEPTKVREGLVLRPGKRLPRRNEFDMRTANVAALDLDLARMGLSLGSPLDAKVTSGRLKLGLVGARGTCVATLNGVPGLFVATGNRLVLDLPGGGGQRLSAFCV